MNINLYQSNPTNPSFPSLLSLPSLQSLIACQLRPKQPAQCSNFLRAEEWNDILHTFMIHISGWVTLAHRLHWVNLDMRREVILHFWYYFHDGTLYKELGNIFPKRICNWMLTKLLGRLFPQTCGNAPIFRHLWGNLYIYCKWPCIRSPLFFLFFKQSIFSDIFLFVS